MDNRMNDYDINRHVLLAKQGNIESQMLLGLYYCNNDNLTKGINILKSASKVSIEAEYILCKIYAFKQHDFIKALKGFESLGKRGYVQAMADAGSFYQKGLGVSANINSALYWYNLATKKGHAISAHSIGYIFYQGLSGSVDLKTAFDYFSFAAKNNYSESCYALGLMYYNGQYVSQNIDLSIKWFEKAVDYGKYEACHSLGYIYNSINNIYPDDERALLWYRLGADNNVVSCASLAGYMYQNGIGCEDDHREAFKYYKISALNNDSDACIEVAIMLKNGIGAAKNQSNAVQWMLRAKELGSDDRFIDEWLRRNNVNPNKGEAAKSVYNDTSSIGVKLKTTTYSGLGERIIQQEIAEERERNRKAQIMKAARSRNSSTGMVYSDNDNGVVFDKDGEISQIVDDKLGIIMGVGSESGIAFYDKDTGTTYDPSNNSLIFNNNNSDLSYNTKDGKFYYHASDELTFK